jgi:hypothetical protein
LNGGNLGLAEVRTTFERGATLNLKVPSATAAPSLPACTPRLNCADQAGCYDLSNMAAPVCSGHGLKGGSVQNKIDSQLEFDRLRGKFVSQ